MYVGVYVPLAMDLCVSFFVLHLSFLLIGLNVIILVIGIPKVVEDMVDRYTIVAYRRAFFFLQISNSII